MRLRGLKNIAFKDKAANGWQGSDLSELDLQKEEEEDLDVAQGWSPCVAATFARPPQPVSPRLPAVCSRHPTAPLYFIDRVYTNAPKQLQVRVTAAALRYDHLTHIAMGMILAICMIKMSLFAGCWCCRA